jgi:L-ribulose-5-phosphate 3-epimerase
MTVELGVMQGRLSPPYKNLIQHYPLKNWKNEFKIAKQIRLKHIEWIFEYSNFKKNIIFNNKKIIELKKIIKKYGVKINVLIMDYFIISKFFNEKNKIIKQNLKIFKKIVKNCHSVGIRIIEIPLVDNASILKMKCKKEVIKNLKKIIMIAEMYKIKISIESDLPPGEFKNFIEVFLPKKIYINYDIGNSASLGYDHQDEIRLLGKYFINVHIKDRILFGKTVELGHGNSNFLSIFQSLKKIKYNGLYTIQGARLDNKYHYIDTIKFYIKFIKNILSKANI